VLTKQALWIEVICIRSDTHRKSYGQNNKG
jgi:hypothetical protein